MTNEKKVGKDLKIVTRDGVYEQHLSHVMFVICWSGHFVSRFETFGFSIRTAFRFESS